MAIERDPTACSTYAKNVGPHILQGDVSLLQPPLGHCDALIAGPPCQGFSTLGKRRPDDPRNQLSLEVVRWAIATRPYVIVIENVAAFLKSPVWKVLADELSSLGYTVSTSVLNALNHGTPQKRLRSFTFASLEGFTVNGSIKGSPGPITVAEAWKDLPSRPDGRNHHYSPTPSPIAAARMKVIPPGGDRRDVLAVAPDLSPPSWKRLRNEATGCWGRLQWDQPSQTLRTTLQNPSKGRYIHPDQDRVISLREAARLQGIDDAWTFEGAPCAVARQIGNSVPMGLGKSVAQLARCWL